MKYPKNKRTVDAIYDNNGTRNPLIEALPAPLDKKDFFEQIQNYPPVPVCNTEETDVERKRRLVDIQNVFIPLDYMYSVYDQIWRMIQSTYNTRSSKQNVIRINSIFANEENLGSYGVQPQSASFLGSPGLGKTSALKRCLSLMPQVIKHEKYLDEPFFCKQILYIFCDTPADSSIRTMCLNIASAIDDAVGSNHMAQILKLRSTSSSSCAAYIKVLCMTYNIGIICVDEIQYIIIEAERTKRMKPLIRFLTELTNDSSTAIFICGTMIAESVFEKEQYLKRRTRGMRLLPFKNDAAYRMFLSKLWTYQYTEKKAVMTQKISDTFYNYSGGVPAYITKLFEEAQVQAIDGELLCINDSIIRYTAELLAIKPAKEMLIGNFISDFSKTVKPQPVTSDKKPEPVRLYAHKKGRRSIERDKDDLIIALKCGEDIYRFLVENELAEVISV